MHELTIRARPPFDFAATARFFRFTDKEVVDLFHEGRYQRALHFGESLFLINVAAQGTRARPSLNISLAPARTITPQTNVEAVNVVRRLFSVEHDLMDWQARVARDPLMRRLEADHRGLRLACWPTLFEALVVSILSQQISTMVAMTFKRRLVERYGERLKVDGQTFYAFPRADALARSDIKELRALGLSNAKALSIIELARADMAGALDGAALEREDNEAIIARLVSLRGIGRWTAEWALMLHFGRTDVFPAGDLFLRGAFIKYYNRGEILKEREIRARAAKRWGAWRSYASLYLLAGMRAGTVTLKPERVLSSLKVAANTHSPREHRTARQVKRSNET